jgi:CheY-like chemotaxis protein
MNNYHTAKHSILWADDDIDDLLIFREVLHDHAPDHEVIEFSNGRHLLTYLQSLEKSAYPCLIVLDINMPLLGGKETLALLKQDARFQHIPVIIFTTSNLATDKNFCDEYQTEMITKPASYALLRTTVENFVDHCGGTYHK